MFFKAVRSINLIIDLKGGNVISSQKSKKFKFSIIMHVHNVEDYLNEAIESIINQDLNFKDNIQLVLINSDSIDNSKKISLDYQAKYPENVICESCESEFSFDAYNFGLEYASGQYVNFMDPNDILSRNLISKVLKSFKKFDVDIVTVPVEYLELRKK